MAQFHRVASLATRDGAELTIILHYFRERGLSFDHAQVSRKHVLALRAWGRQTDGPTNIDNALYFGGPETVRGYPYAQREGEEGYLLSAEYRMPLFLMPISPRGEIIGAGFHLFTDAGDAWYHGAEAGRSMFSYGAGFHLNIDKLQLRFEAARTREGAWMFEFMDTFNF